MTLRTIFIIAFFISVFFHYSLVLVHDLIYRLKHNMYPFCSKGDKYEK